MKIKFRGSFWRIKDDGIYRNGYLFDSVISTKNTLWVQATKKGLKVVTTEYTCYVNDTGLRVKR